MQYDAKSLKGRSRCWSNIYVEVDIQIVYLFPISSIPVLFFNSLFKEFLFFLLYLLAHWEAVMFFSHFCKIKSLAVLFNFCECQSIYCEIIVHEILKQCIAQKLNSLHMLYTGSVYSMAKTFKFFMLLLFFVLFHSKIITNVSKKFKTNAIFIDVIDFRNVF